LNGASYALYTGSTGGLSFYVTDGVTFYLSPDAGGVAWDGDWHGVVGTFDGTTVRLYVDGAEVASGTPAPTTVAYGLPDDDLTLGTANCPGTSYTGGIDDVRVYQRVLGAAEVASPPQCSDHVDNDSDGKIDFGAGVNNDPGCPTTAADSEGNPPGGGGEAPAASGRCAGRAATIVGTTGADVLSGTGGVDVVQAGAGNDTVRALQADDVVCGGRGDDRLFGGPGRDLLIGGAGRDRIRGQGGDDRVFGGSRGGGPGGAGAKPDSCNGGKGNDSIRCKRPG
jgi:concanavalin A-like lectin/glucanase superfamily protein/hemolysin type calcium-binding protein